MTAAGLDPRKSPRNSEGPHGRLKGARIDAASRVSTQAVPRPFVLQLTHVPPRSIADLEKRFLLPTYNRYPVGFERGKGVFLYDFEGKKYLDFRGRAGCERARARSSRIVKIIRAQAARVIHVSNLYYNEYQDS